MHLNLRPRVLNCPLGGLSIGFSLFSLHTALCSYVIVAPVTAAVGDTPERGIQEAAE